MLAFNLPLVLALFLGCIPSRDWKRPQHHASPPPAEAPAWAHQEPALPSVAPASPTQANPPAQTLATAGDVTLARGVILPEPELDPRALVVYETPYKLGARRRLPEREAAEAEDQELARWNEGGRDGKWHPAPRVVIDNAQVKGSIKANVVLREARKQGYPAIRRCYDPALVDNPELGGKISIRFTIQAAGNVTKPAAVGRGTLKNAKVKTCIAKGFGALRFPRPKTGTTSVTLDVDVHPGDAPVRPAEDPPATAGAGSLDTGVVQGLVAGQAGARVQQCMVDALRRTPGLWGRLVLRADVASNGVILKLVETESTFPDAVASGCVASAIRQATLPEPRGGELRLVVPLRLGQP